ncbi:F0F1 ATP synthase subunit B [Aureimonas sp. AU4]|uniref:F0F1 ATP synthase subunit B n=1 Tax=Aureimonas sp. AU4 TaxID=1638163 RepID=UPI000781C891|nr:F0F1 ATP synthase subunit B [Aureimonas sp. AU4]
MAFDNSFWAFIGLILFFVLVAYLKAPSKLSQTLDRRAQRIRNELAEAQALKEESKRQLAEYQRRRREAETEARDIVAAAQREAAALVDEARQKSEDYVARRTQIAEQKIAQAEADAIAEVRSTAVDIAVNAATRIIAERNVGGDTRLLDQSIDDVRRRLN